MIEQIAKRLRAPKQNRRTKVAIIGLGMIVDVALDLVKAGGEHGV